MPVLLVLCNSDATKKQIDALKRAIRSYRDFVALSETSYLIYVDKSSREVHNSIRDSGGFNSDALLVLTVPQPYIGRAPKKARLWFQQLRDRYGS